MPASPLRSTRRHSRRFDDKAFWANAYLAHAMNPECRDAAEAADRALECYEERFPRLPDPEDDPTPGELKEEIVDRFVKLGLSEESARSLTNAALTIR
jgi:hypothetical protein